MCMRRQCRCRTAVAVGTVRRALRRSNSARVAHVAPQHKQTSLFSSPFRTQTPSPFFFFNNTPGGGTKARLSSQVMRTEDRVPAAEAVPAVQTASDAAATKKLQCEARIFFLSALSTEVKFAEWPLLRSNYTKILRVLFYFEKVSSL